MTKIFHTLLFGTGLVAIAGLGFSALVVGVLAD
jgi:hypothetical protein